MTPEQARESVGRAVAYRGEHGIVQRVGSHGEIAFVRYGTDSHAKATYTSDLTLLHP